MSDITIRRATPADAEEIATLINEFSRFERVTAEALPSAMQLEKHLAEDAQPKLRCLIAEVDGTIAGFAMYFFHYSTFRTNWGLYLEDLFVREQYREQGIGRRFFAELGTIAREYGSERLDLLMPYWNHRGTDYCTSLGGKVVTGRHLIRFEKEALKAL